jgi:hypothetical protein
MTLSIMHSAIYAEFYYAECCSLFILIVVMLSVVMLSDVVIIYAFSTWRSTRLSDTSIYQQMFE